MFNQELIDYCWSNAQIVDGFDPANFRKDCCGAWIVKNQYGNRDSIYGWEIDHVYPEALGGKDDKENLRAMQWENNVSKGDDYPVYQARIKSEANKNIVSVTQYTVNESLRNTLSRLYKL